MTRWINADELKKLFATECATECAVCSFYNDDAEVDVECHCLLLDEAATTNDVKEICVANVTFDKEELEKIVNERVIEKIKTGELALQDNRKTGKWIKIDPETRGYAEFFRCSNCLTNVQLSYWDKECDYNYCPNCGARMEEPAT